MTQTQHSTLAKQDIQGQQVRASRAEAQDLETHESHKSASASAGLNLNLFGALAGALSSSSKKSTRENPEDGTRETVSERVDRASAAATAKSSASAHGAVKADDYTRAHKAHGTSAQQGEARAVKGSRVDSEQVDHLGIEN
ncbi:hypothetical protein J1614_003805 [Plenodomus biglobosus]|nr:hypothetical protein J1614_003805 [Plenodomus biglobosus]